MIWRDEGIEHSLITMSSVSRPSDLLKIAFLQFCLLLEVGMYLEEVQADVLAGHRGYSASQLGQRTEFVVVAHQEENRLLQST